MGVQPGQQGTKHNVCTPLPTRGYQSGKAQHTAKALFHQKGGIIGEVVSCHDIQLFRRLPQPMVKLL